ncbi:efflux RND transporter periplasmic adaptor subunit [Pantoea rwandensis]|uniref:Efflux transporter periplasmic adaptor subunit n=1 Tax=Pantoea rwandensis TaxID=1076550 RepID=A0A1X1CQI9_9GAMM|nr:HlyD family secretion protein [Pantoea rwandensis]ORM66587.1 efflux transporter periplasmic adaptor subunit [Pantoea rwandensis]
MSNHAFTWKSSLKALFTLLMVGIALFLAVTLWRAYVLAPWTRDGRVSAQVIRIAPEVSGTVSQLTVGDNQYVAKGALLYNIDPARFELAVSTAQAQLNEATATLLQKREEEKHRQQMGALMAAEDRQRAREAALVAEAQQQQALAALSLARLNLQRAAIRAPVDGYVTHLHLQPGDYAVAGTPDIALVDAHSFWVTGYFEETKLQRMQIGDRVHIRLMGQETMLAGHIASFGRGISDSNQISDTQGLPSVEATFSWIRLAQRIPVRIEFDALPDNQLLTAGMSCSIAVIGNRTPQGRLTSLLTRWL